MTKLVRWQPAGGRGGWAHWCPACRNIHVFRTEGDKAAGDPIWTFDGDMERPTFTPSMLIRAHDPDGELPDHICHYIMTRGEIAYCGDSTHALKGQTVPLPDAPDWMIR